MSKRYSLQPAFVLHTRRFQDKKFLVELFTERYGRLVAVVTSASGPRSRSRSLLQPFVPILASWRQGQSELVTMSSPEANGPVYALSGDALLCGFYLNELLVRLLPKAEPNQPIYQAYQATLLNLYQGVPTQPALRCFEKFLVSALGYGVEFEQDASTHSPIQPACSYRYVAGKGFVIVTSGRSHTHDELNQVQKKDAIYLGEYLLAIGRDDYRDPETLRLAKRLMRQFLSPLLGEKPIKSRELFCQPFSA